MTLRVKGSTSWTEIGSGSTPPPTPPVPGTWTRPAEWTALPNVLPSEQKVAGIIGVPQSGMDATIKIGTSTGTYSVDWGDGNTSTGTASGTVLTHSYTYASLSSAVTSSGYKTALVTVTPDSGDMIEVDFQNVIAGFDNGMSIPWLDIVIAGETITTLFIASHSTTTLQRLVRMAALERCRVLSSSVSNINYMLHSCVNLQVFEFGTSVDLTSANSAFYGCYSLLEAPALEMSQVTTTASMFLNCHKLVIGPEYGLDSCVSTNAMFSNCRSMQIGPNLTGTGGVLDMSGMFSGCAALVSLLPLDTSGATNMSNFFASCVSIAEFPDLDTSSCLNFGSFFHSCSQIIVPPSYDTSSATSMGFMFYNCTGITQPPDMDTQGVTDMAYMFYGCIALRTPPAYNTSDVTTMSSMFYGCRTLEYLPPAETWDTSKVALMTQFAQDCNSIKEFPLYDTANVTDMYGLVANCQSLQFFPALNTSKVTTMQNMFTSCEGLLSVPWMDTSKVTNMQNAFNSLYGLTELPAFNLRSLTSTSSAFLSMGLRRVPIVGIRVSFAVQNSSMGAAALDELYFGLADRQAYTINGAVGDGTSVVYTTTVTHHMVVGQRVTVTGITPSIYNVTDGVVTAVTSNTFTVVKTDIGAYTSGGSIAALSAATITISGNPGTTGDNSSIATAKGWTVSG